VDKIKDYMIKILIARIIGGITRIKELDYGEVSLGKIERSDQLIVSHA